MGKSISKYCRPVGDWETLAVIPMKWLDDVMETVQNETHLEVCVHQQLPLVAHACHSISLTLSQILHLLVSWP